MPFYLEMSMTFMIYIYISLFTHVINKRLDTITY